jgi:large subunit ribosomal protein L9
MQVILLEDVQGKGSAGDVVKVSDGHARNYLFPHNIAIPATKENLKTLESRKARLDAKKADDLASAQEKAEKIDSLSVTIQSKAGEGGKLFGSIGAQDIADAVLAQHEVYIDKRKIQLDAPIKETGVHSVELKIYPEVTATIRVLVEA